MSMSSEACPYRRIHREWAARRCRPDMIGMSRVPQTGTGASYPSMVSEGAIRFEVVMVPCTVNLRRASGANTGGWVTRRSVAGPRWLNRWIHPRGRRLVGDQVVVGAGLAAYLVPAAGARPGGGVREADRGSPRRVLDRGRRRGRDRDIDVPGRGLALRHLPALDLHALLHPLGCLLAVGTSRVHPLPV